MRAASLLGFSILFVALWSSGWVVSRFAIDDISAIALLTTRYCLLFLILMVVVTAAGHWRRLSRSDLVCHLCVGILSHSIYLLTGVGAFELGVSAGLVAFVTALQPMTTAFLTAPITKERITARQWKGLFIGFLAVLLLVSESYRHGISAVALAMPFLSVLALSLGALINRRIELKGQEIKRSPTPVTFILLIHSVGALSVLIPLSTFTGQFKLDYNLSQWMVVLWLAVVVSLGAYAVMLTLLRHLSAMRVSSLSYLVPPATMIQAYWLFNDSITGTDLAGLAVAAIGVYLVMAPIRAKPTNLTQELSGMFQTNHRSELQRSLPLNQSNRTLLATLSPNRDPDIEL